MNQLCGNQDISVLPSMLEIYRDEMSLLRKQISDLSVASEVNKKEVLKELKNKIPGVVS